MANRGSGILLHITSLPSPYGIGDMGPSAYGFAEFLAETGQRYWQILPLSPTDLSHGNSPYHSASAFAFNPLMINPEPFIKERWLRDGTVPPLPGSPEDHVDFGLVEAFKKRILDLAYDAFQSQGDKGEYETFCRENTCWLDDFALFSSLKSLHGGGAWNTWPEDLRDRRPEAMEWAREKFRVPIEKVKWQQYIFSRQWAALKAFCNEKGIEIIGDLPIYVVHDSVDVWSHPELFKLDDTMRPSVVAGVPPDYFSETGQRWGNPVYRWDVLRNQGYDWWIRRMAHCIRLFDLVRVDHFRGFQAYWEIPAGEGDAVNGQWVEGPGEGFFARMKEAFPHLPIIAEDLGYITPEVWELMDRFGFPGMKVLLFAFGNDIATNPYAPHNHVRNCVVYTGTHDNNTARGWFERELTSEDRERVCSYIGREIDAAKIHWELIRLAMMSVADTVIIPVQDVLGLGEEGRMNRPATEDGNWEWRLTPDQPTSSIAQGLLKMTRLYGRDRSYL